MIYSSLPSSPFFHCSAGFVTPRALGGTAVTVSWVYVHSLIRLVQCAVKAARCKPSWPTPEHTGEVSQLRGARHAAEYGLDKGAAPPPPQSESTAGVLCRDLSSERAIRSHLASCERNCKATLMNKDRRSWAHPKKNKVCSLLACTGLPRQRGSTCDRCPSRGQLDTTGGRKQTQEQS